MEKVREKVLFALQEVQRAVIGKQEVTETVMKAFLAGGHVLVEDIPGLGKTTMAIAFSRAIGLQKRRVQFTPDVLPSDLTGFTIYQKERNAFVYHPGAVVCNLLLADEINRASPKTQSALLEVMEEGQVTVDGKTRKIAPPFLVIATENPSGSAGTQLLPESQLDRFMVCVKMGYPTIREEMEILRKNENGRTSDAVQQVMTKEELEEAQRETAQIFMHERILEYLVQLAQATREHEMLELGMSPRGTVALAKMAKAGAYLAGREYVVPADVRGVFRETAQHRILLNTRARISKVKQKEVLQEILSAVESPSLKKRYKGAYMGKRMITYLLVLGAVGYLFLMYIYPALSGLLIFVLLYPAAGIVYLIFAGRGLSARVKRLSDYGEKEQQMKVSIQVCRESSLWIGKCRILLEMEHAVSGIRQKDSLWLSEKQADYTFEPDRCGEWKLTITEVRIYDFIGILSVGKKQQEKERFTVLPKICAMPVEIGRRTREFPVEPETYSNERGGQDATEIYQIREYHIPDPVQMIHWKISAKAGKMMVKESSHPLGCAVCIRLWLSDAAKDFKKLERMIEICASLSRTLVEEHCMHVVAWFDQKNVRVVRWRVKDEETFYEMLWELMEAVPVAKREEEQSGFEEVFRTQKFSSVLVLDGQGIQGWNDTGIIQV